jgi:D-glycero-D-manno-heptose 1,7-bisphosphate phosphatase
MDRPGVFLDRDGVLNAAIIRDGRPYPPMAADQLTILPGVPEACRALRSRGYVLAIVTNQPDIARGTLDMETLDQIHARLQERVCIDSVWVCPHDDDDHCSCRKPAPGLLLAAAAHHHLDLRSSFLIGDRWRDIEAGRAAGCRTILIRKQTYRERQAVGADIELPDLTQAASWIDAEIARAQGATP